MLILFHLKEHWTGLGREGLAVRKNSLSELQGVGRGGRRWPGPRRGLRADTQAASEARSGSQSMLLPSLVLKRPHREPSHPGALPLSPSPRAPLPLLTAKDRAENVGHQLATCSLGWGRQCCSRARWSREEAGPTSLTWDRPRLIRGKSRLDTVSKSWGCTGSPGPQPPQPFSCWENALTALAA